MNLKMRRKNQRRAAKEEEEEVEGASTAEGDLRRQSGGLIGNTNFRIGELRRGS